MFCEALDGPVRGNVWTDLRGEMSLIVEIIVVTKNSLAQQGDLQSALWLFYCDLMQLSCIIASWDCCPPMFMN